MAKDENVRRYRIQTFLESVWRLWSYKRGKLLPREELNKRLDICIKCDQFDGNRCNLCGCCTNEFRSFFNKLAYPTERCPADPPKWLEVP
jgi:hypothetical protein